MTETDNRVQEFLTPVIAGSLVGQIARKRGLPFTDLLDLTTSDLTPAAKVMVDELDALGIDPGALAGLVVDAMVRLLAHPQNTALITPQMAALLWSVLGDPENGGEAPQIYHRAAAAVHMVFLGILDPELITTKP